eukprot:scaffold10136_cov162-Amphora_coffeaeformis.AAC.2
MIQPRSPVGAPSLGGDRQHVLYQQQEDNSQPESFEFFDSIRKITSTRREWWTTTMRVVSSSAMLTLPLPATADDAEEKEGLVSTKRIVDLLRAVPTFTIVDQKGVPYMVVGEDAKVTGLHATPEWRLDIFDHTTTDSVVLSTKATGRSLPQSQRKVGFTTTRKGDGVICTITRNGQTRWYGYGFAKSGLCRTHQFGRRSQDVPKTRRQCNSIRG